MIFKYHNDGTLPKDGESIFVFGSNLSGRHGAGAAKEAVRSFGAKWGEFVGFTGRSYAIPTVNETITGVLSLEEIKKYIDEFNDITYKNPDKKFFITRVGCGLAGYKNDAIAPLFKKCNPENCSLPDVWVDYLEDKNEK